MVATELLFGLRERAIAGDQLAVLLAHGGGHRGRLKLRTGAKVTALDDSLNEFAILLHDLVLLGFRHLRPQRLVEAAHQHVLHSVPSFRWVVERAAARSTPLAIFFGPCCRRRPEVTACARSPRDGEKYPCWTAMGTGVTNDRRPSSSIWARRW